MFLKNDLVISSLVKYMAYPLISKCFIPLKDVKFISFILVFIKYLQSKEQSNMLNTTFFLAKRRAQRVTNQVGSATLSTRKKSIQCSPHFTETPGYYRTFHNFRHKNRKSRERKTFSLGAKEIPRATKKITSLTSTFPQIQTLFCKSTARVELFLALS